MTRTLTFGEALGVLSPVQAGRLCVGSLMTLSVAGAEFNVAVGLARLGIPTTFAGAVGSDATGRLIIQTLKAEGVDTADILVRPEPTGHFIKERYGLRMEPNVYYVREGSAMRQWKAPDPLPEAWLSMDWIHTTAITWMLGEPLRRQAQNLLENLARSASGIISVDLNIRKKLGAVPEWREVIEQMIPLTGILFATQSEIEELWDIHQVSELWSQHVLQGGHILVVKHGAEGARVFQDGELLAEAPSRAVRAVQDVVGAGDGFAAGVIAGRLKGRDWRDCLRLGHLVGAFSVAHPGDWEGYPLWEEVQAVGDDTWVDR